MFKGEIPEGVPVYQHIKEELKRRIDGGRLAADDRVPSELELARELSISRSQARQALRDLEMEGYLVRRQGLGSFVAPARNRIKHLGMTGFRVVAIAFPTVYSRYMRRVIEAIRTRLQRDGFQMLTYFTSHEDQTEREFLQELRNSGIEGVALWINDRSQATQAVLQTYKDTSFPFVLWDRYVPGFEADLVASDNVEVGYRLAKTLCEQGHRSIGFISMNRGVTTNEERFEGYRRALRDAGIGYSSELVALTKVNNEFPETEVRHVLAQGARPTALFCADDTVVSHVLPMLRELGYSLPEDMAFAAVDDGGILDSLGLPIVVAFQRPEEIGARTAELLIGRIANPTKSVEKRLLGADFVTPSQETGEGEEEEGKEVVAAK